MVNAKEYKLSLIKRILDQDGPNGLFEKHMRHHFGTLWPVFDHTFQEMYIGVADFPDGLVIILEQYLSPIPYLIPIK